ncbi:MAG: NAD-dependent epimerase/dehydratase family protein [Nitrospinota bacterium]|nr:NAD-dependent epimerase/dehydratase family protein [Nitrospinota bacterium]
MKIDRAAVLVTGASGFIGSHLVDYLLTRGCVVHCLVRKSSNLQWLDSSRVHLHKADLDQPGLLGDCLGDIEYLFHCAGLTRAKTRQEYFRVNADLCSPFYQECVARGKRLKAVIHLSSLAAVGPAGAGRSVDEETLCQPLTYYGKSKLAGEEIARNFSAKVPMVILRPPIVYGPREINFFNYLKTVNNGWNIKIGKVQRNLSLVYVTDLVRAMVKAVETPDKRNNVYFVTDGNVYSWEDVAQMAMRILKVKARSVTIPEKALIPVVFICESLARFTAKPALLDRQRLIDICQSSWTASSKKFLDHYDFLPQYDLHKGLEETFHWYKTYHWL